ncbi:MAG: PQQ-binding-like beta-propeller repeat protein [Acidimicrobiaceae bacterium]|nr:PQQ-binding-like beta-propeller repeat protein [Acidimicrobiaceae bacterium]
MSAHRPSLPLRTLLVTLTILTTPLLASSPTLAATSGATLEWTQYHGSALGAGEIPVNAVHLRTPVWTSPTLDGQIFGQPLVFDSRVYVATENNSLYALSSFTGRVLWRTHLGTPVQAKSLPCGDIYPTVGITGTPIIDPARHELFAVAFESRGARFTHVVVGLSTLNGMPLVSTPVDPPGVETGALLQRTALALDHGSVVFGFGGNSGDCGPYRGRVVSVPEIGGAPRFFTIDATAHQREGAVWMGAAGPVVDPRGNIWVESGNGSVTTSGRPYDRSDAVLELSSSLRLEQFFAPSDWTDQNAADLDLSSSVALLGNGAVLGAGKAGYVYLLNKSHLGGIGGDLAHLDACPGSMDGGVAVAGATVYFPCLGGVVAVQASLHPLELRELWSSGQGGSSPVYTRTQVLSLGGDGVLVALNRRSGHLESSFTLSGVANHFPTPGFGDGHVLVAQSRSVVAFATS